MVSSYMPAENRPLNSPSMLVKPVFNSRVYLTYPQDKDINCARQLLRTLESMSAWEGQAYSDMYPR